MFLIKISFLNHIFNKHFMEYDYEESRVVKEIRERKAKRVLLQLPEGLKKEAFRLVRLIKDETKAEAIVSGSSCWGGCDLALDEFDKLKCDLIIHFGHAPFITAKYQIIYIELHAKNDMTKVLEKNLNKLKINKIGLISSIQFIKQIDNIKDFLESKKKKVIIPNKKGFSYYDGHVVGCEYNCLIPIRNDIDGVLVIGNKFHSLGAALMLTDKKVYLLNEHTEKIEDMDNERDKIIKQRAIAIDKTKRAKKIGIMIDLKPGQYNLKTAENLKEKLEKLGKEVIIISIKEATPSGLMSFYDVDAFIDTACPRIAVEDCDKYEKPMITSREAKIVLNEISWEEMLEKGLIGFI